MGTRRRIAGVVVAAAAAAGGLAVGLPRPEAARLAGSWPRPALDPSADAAAKEQGQAPTGFAEPYFPFLDGEPRAGSISVGCTSHGYVVNSRELGQGAEWAILPEQRARDLAYGTDDTIALVQFAARRLHERTGTRLWVGNIGRRGGGDVVYSVSHNSGRDVDLAFCYRQRGAEAVPPPGLVRLNSEGLSKDGRLELDAERTWMVVRALLEHPSAQVQYIFVATPLKRLLLAHAHERGEPPELVSRAAAVMGQPSAAAAHDDHLHVRLYCSQRDVEGGCLNTGAIHPWARTFEAEREARIVTVAASLRHRAPEQRRRALQRLVLLNAEGEADAVADRLADEAPRVRQAAAEALGALGAGEHVEQVSAALAGERDFFATIALLEALGDLGGAAAAIHLGRFIDAEQRTPWARMGPATGAVIRASATPLSPLLDVVPAGAVAYGTARAAMPVAISPEWRPADGQPSEATAAAVALRLVAIDAAGASERLEPVEALLRLLGSPTPALRARAARALGRLTNRTFGRQWHQAAAAPAWRTRNIRRWRQWLESHRGQPRDVLVASGFVAAGFRVQRIHQKHLWELVRAVAAADHLSYNAQRALARLTDHDPPTATWSKHEACHHWFRWLQRRRSVFRLSRPPLRLRRICG